MLEFVWEDMNEMKAKIRAEFARQEEVAKTQQMYEDYVAQQKKQLNKLLKQKKTKKPMAKVR